MARPVLNLEGRHGGTAEASQTRLATCTITVTRISTGSHVDLTAPQTVLHLPCSAAICSCRHDAEQC
eukprot:995212-Rhodomonas_salina.3